jgi:chemotaxis protein methyltransferase WspC
LAPGGYLFVGPAEAFLASCSGFAPANQAMSFAFRGPAAKPLKSAGISFRRPANAGKTPAKKRTQSAVMADRPVASVPGTLVPPAGLTIVRSLADAGRLQEAAEGCDLHMQQHGPSCEAYYLMGLVKGAAGNNQGAAECYRRVLYLEPEHGEALMHLALLTETLGNTAAAERLRERARRVERKANEGTS